ncbi:MAG: hypothetical protein IJA06_00345 [Oscillospiraceae bacterium]|nr:hypothetical protein [Oscillospiraceae bacterium]MBQ3560253.1 hypothetical protein [Oscillospiraceae bacterium]
MNYIYLILGIVLGLVFLGRGKNTRNKKFIPYEVKTKLKTKKTMEEYEDWCRREATGCSLLGGGFVVFGISATFMDSNALISTIIAVASLLLFLVGFFMRIYNNKKHLNHYFTK